MNFYGKVSAIVAVIVVTSITVIFLFKGGAVDGNSYFEVENGKFEILVTVTGELEAESSVRINGPQELQSRNIRLRNIPILAMIPEGTEVVEGDWIATLDRTEAELSLRDLQDQVLSEEAQYNSTQLDTTIKLSNLRDDLINLEHTVEERQLVLEQSHYEPPATIRQAEINVERANLDLDQAGENYVLFRKQAEEIMKEAEINLERRRRRYQALSNVIDKFEIYAPESGLIIYHREWNGAKRTVGSTIHSRDLTVVVIPDVSSLVSRAFVNEIDVEKVRTGQSVVIGVDAYPDRTYPGSVVEVSNVGMEMPNTDARVFEVLIKVEQSDSYLLPAMTSSNIIVSATYEDVHFIPLAALHYHEGIPYVYKSDGVRQIVRPGPANDNFIIIDKGLDDGDLVYLSRPDDSEGFEFAGRDLIAGGSS